MESGTGDPPRGRWYPPTVSGAPNLPRNQSLKRALAVVRAMSASPTGLSATELARQVGLPRQTVGRLLTTLADEEWARRSPDGFRWVLGEGLAQIARAANPHRRLVADSQRPLAILAKDTGLSATLAVHESATRVDVITQVDPPDLLAVVDWIGRDVPPHASAGAKVAMSGLSDLELQAEVRSLDMRRLTPHTIVDREVLIREVRKARRSGLATTLDEIQEGLSGLAVLVPSKGATPLTVAVYGPSARLRPIRSEAIASCRRCAEEVAAIADRTSEARP